MSKCIAFLPRNQFHIDLFAKVGKFMREKFGFEILHSRELGDIKGEKVFQFEKSIEKKWNDIDISYSNLCNLVKEYPDGNLIRALYCEREYNFFPKYFNDKPIPYEEQLKYLVGCFLVFEEWLDQNNVICVVSELLTGLPDSVLYTICKKRGIQYISLRSSKLLPGIIMCEQDFDLPSGMLDVYEAFSQKGIPDRYYDLAKSHINELRAKIEIPNYMQLSKQKFRLLAWRRVHTFVARLGKNRIPTNAISLFKHPVRNPALWNIHRLLNVTRTRINKSRWFCKEIPSGEKYFVYPLHYEPEASTLVRAFPFSDQMCVIQQIAKALPLGITLVVKEHRGNQGYRKSEFYRELQYLPNVKLVPPEMDGNSLINNSIGIVTLTSRMGWEALVLGKPVVAFGSAFWTCFEQVKKPGSWMELKRMIEECVTNKGYKKEPDYDKKLLAYTAAYISLIHKGNFVLGSRDLLAESNVENIAKALFSAII